MIMMTLLSFASCLLVNDFQLFFSAFCMRLLSGALLGTVISFSFSWIKERVVLSVVCRSRLFLTIISGLCLCLSHAHSTFFFPTTARHQDNLCCCYHLISRGSFQWSSYFSSFWIQNWRLSFLTIFFLRRRLLKIRLHDGFLSFSLFHHVQAYFFCVFQWD